MPDPLFTVLDAQLDPEDAYDGPTVLEGLVDTYASFVAWSDVCVDEPEDPDEALAEYLWHTYEWEGEAPTTEAVRSWAEENAEAIAQAVPMERMKAERSELLDGFHKLRRQGKTVVQAAKKLGAEPHYLLHIASTDDNGFRGEATKRAHAAQREHERYRAAVARRRMLGSMATKLEKELKSRDLSDLPTKDLAHLLLKLAEVARDEEPPKLGVAVGFTTV